MSEQTKTLQKQSAVPKTVKSWLTSDYFKQQVALVLPTHLKAERFVRVAITALTRIPKLAQCTPESVLKCMMTLSELGLEPDGRRAHLIPFGQECTLIVDYKGLVELAMNSGLVSSIYADVIRRNDQFTWDTGEIKHIINFMEDRGEMYGAYCVIKFKDGGKHTEVMTKPDVDRIRARSKAKNNGPWVTDYEEMAKKTVFRRASKWIKLSPEVQDALDKDADDGKAPASLVSEIVPPMALPEPEPEGPIVEEPPDKQETPPEPEKPQEEAKAPEAGSSLHTVQQSLGELVTEAGHNYDDFARWAVRSGNLPDADSLPGWDAVPTEVARRLLRARVGLLQGIAKEKGQL